ncbi:MAG: ribbon-helix-helix domain-containing protein [bacterium]
MLITCVFIGTKGVQQPVKIISIKYKEFMNKTDDGYKKNYEPKKKILYSRMDDTMIDRLKEIRTNTGISTSEIIREAIRRLLKEIDETGEISLKIN